MGEGAQPSRGTGDQATDLSRRPAGLTGLSRREREVLALVCDGWAYDDVAQRLDPPVSARTVKFHMANVYIKLGLDHLPDAARQRELGRLCPLVSALAPDPAPPLASEDTESEPLAPPDHALVAVDEDERAVVAARLGPAGPPPEAEASVAPDETPGVDAAPVGAGRRRPGRPTTWRLLGLAALLGVVFGGIVGPLLGLGHPGVGSGQAVAPVTAPPRPADSPAAVPTAAARAVPPLPPGKEYDFPPTRTSATLAPAPGATPRPATLLVIPAAEISSSANFGPCCWPQALTDRPFDARWQQTRWETRVSRPPQREAWFEFDLGQVRSLDHVRWLPGMAGQTLTLAVSSDGQTWETVVTRGADAGGPTTVNSTTWPAQRIGRAARYLRFTFANTPDLALPKLGGIVEVEVYATH